VTDDGHGAAFRRAASRTDLARVTETVTLAFGDDPTWSPLLSPAGTLDAAREYWRFFIDSAQRYPWAFTNDEGSVAAVWYPPGATELTPDEEERFPSVARCLLGNARATELLEAVDRFEAATPSGEFFYLSLLAVHPSRRGQGLGMQLLAETLQEIDALGVPSYLESSNPANDAKYERLGYRRHGSFTIPSGLELTTMWRDPSPSTVAM